MAERGRTMICEAAGIKIHAVEEMDRLNPQTIVVLYHDDTGKKLIDLAWPERLELFRCRHCGHLIVR